MRLRTTALGLLAALSLSSMTSAAEPEEAIQPHEENPTAPAPAVESADESAPKPSETPPAPHNEMDAEAAAQAAREGKIDYAKEKIDPHFATAAEIAAHNATAAPDDKIVCRREQLTGSHRHVKVCMTVAQRREILEKTQTELDTAGRNQAGPLRGN